MSSIQPGTICKIVNAPQYNGRMVVALERAAGSEFRLPDGHISCSEPGEWCIESLDGEFAVHTTSFRSRTTRYVVCAARYLKPFDPGAGTDEILLKAGKPKANDLAPKPELEHAR
jgi:hypothetical protein